jgi:Secretion system C-terminal sorting domain
MNKFLLFLTGLTLTSTLFAQTGPNNPAVGANVAGIGTLAWLTPERCTTSNNARSTVGPNGISNYLQGTVFGFAIVPPANIDGIVVGIEKSTSAPTNVALLDGWSTGLTKAISAGNNRILIVIYGQENGTGTRDITAMTYGGQAMTQLSQNVLPGGAAFNDRIEVWYLLNAGIAAAGSTTIVPTYAGGVTLTEYCEVFSSATFSNVDQLDPAPSSTVSGFNGATDPHQLGSALTTYIGSMSINGVVCGNNTTAASVAGPTTSYTINLGYTEGTDVYFSTVAPAAGNATGACLQTAHLAHAAAGTIQPTCDFRGTVNRHVMAGFVLQRARELDNEVRIVKGGAITGTNLAVAGTAWTTVDTYTNYGTATELWGTTWTVADINAVDFGAAISTRVTNGTAQVDHIRITVYSTSTLPIELLDFTATAKESWVDLNWITATETNNDYFLVQRSHDGITFEDIGQLPGAGNSSSTLFYEMKDLHPLQGTSYYRLKQVDFDGAFDYSPIRVVTFNSNDLLIYPNPTTDGSITIYNDNVQINSVAVYSSDLKLVKMCTLIDGVNPIVNIEDLADGAYFILVKSEYKSEIVKVLKQTREH